MGATTQKLEYWRQEKLFHENTYKYLYEIQTDTKDRLH